MKAKEIEQRLRDGEKLSLKINAYFADWYFVGEEKPENRINEKQFEKYKALCMHSDETGKDSKWFRGQSYRLFYWGLPEPLRPNQVRGRDIQGVENVIEFDVKIQA